MFDSSDVEILRFLNSTGRLQSFLLEVPKIQLQNAIQEKQRLQDIAFHEQRNTGSNAFKRNVLDFTMSDVIKACYDEKILNYFEYKMANESSRLQNHPVYGMRLISRYPETYYIGEKSNHFNHARQIQELYGIRHEEQDQNNSGISDSVERQKSFIDDESEIFDQENVPEQEKSQIEQQSSEDNHFIVDDSIIESQNFDIIDDLETMLKQKKRKLKQKKNQRNEKLKRKSSSQKQSSQKQEKTKLITKKLTKVRNLRKLDLNKSDDENLQKSYVINEVNQQQNICDSSKVNKVLKNDPETSEGKKSQNKIQVTMQMTIDKKLNDIIFRQLSMARNSLSSSKRKMCIQSEED